LAKHSLVLATILATISIPTSVSIAAAQTGPSKSGPSLLVNILDRKGNPLRDLTKDNFKVKINGHPASIDEADYSLGPRRIVVLLDISGSMKGPPRSQKWRVVREALDDLLSETPSNVAIALLTFSDQVHAPFDFSQSRASITAWLKQEPSQLDSRVHGKTALFDAIVAAAKLLQPARPGDAIYAITDGGDNGSHTSEWTTRKLLSDSGIRLFLFFLGEPSVNEEENHGKQSVIETVRATGGYAFGVTGYEGIRDPDPFLWFNFAYDYDERTRERIELHTQALNIQVNGFYTLRLEPVAVHEKAGKVSLRIVDRDGKARKDVILEYPRALPTEPR
jgi:von Willebrand factor type A domain